MTAACKLCGRIFTSIEGPLVMGQKTSDSLARALTELGEHLRDKHPEALEQAVATAAVLSANLMGAGLLANFESADPELLRQRDQLDAAVVRLLRRRQTDEQLEARFGGDWHPTNRVLDELKAVRDYLEYKDVPEPEFSLRVGAVAQSKRGVA